MHPRMAPRLPLESEAGTQSQVSLRSLGHTMDRVDQALYVRGGSRKPR